MERAVFLVVGDDEYCLGTAKEVIASRRPSELLSAIRDIVEDLVFSTDSGDYTVMSIELR